MPTLTQTHLTRSPFAASHHARTTSSVLTLAACASPATLVERLRDRAGVSLLESTLPTARGGRMSLVAAAPVLRLTLRDGELRAQALDERGETLLRELDLEAVTRTPQLDGRTDVERLLAPNAFDGLRRLVHLVADREESAKNAFPIALIGAFGFDLIGSFEQLPPRTTNPETAEIDVVLALDGVVYDHLLGEVHVTTRALDFESLESAQARAKDLEALLLEETSEREISPTQNRLPEIDDAGSFLVGVERILEHIREGDVFQAVLSRHLDVANRANPLDVYRRLVRDNPSPHHFFLGTEDGELFGASPEPAVLVRDGQVEISPIAGTRPRGRGANGRIDPEVDSRLALALVNDPKEQAEHAMLVDLARNDVARVCVPGTRRLTDAPRIERFSHVQHLVSRVTGQLRPEFDALTAYAACANMGTLTGAPKLRATEIVRELEPVSRGFYGGAVGILTASDDLTTAITIRSLHHRDGIYRLQAGAGVVAASTPERELDEVRHKLAAPYSALCATEEV